MVSLVVGYERAEYLFDVELPEGRPGSGGSLAINSDFANEGNGSRNRLCRPGRAAPRRPARRRRCSRNRSRALAVAALGVHQHGIDDHAGRASTSTTGLWAAGEIGAVARFSISPSMPGRGGIGAQAASSSQSAKGSSGDRSMRVGLVRRRAILRAARGARRRLGAQVLARRQQQVVGADDGRMLCQQLARDGLAVEALLQVAKKRPRRRAADQQLAVDARLRQSRRRRHRERRRRCRRRCANRAVRAARADSLDADAVPFPFGAKSAGSSAARSASSSGVGQHHRAEQRGVARMPASRSRPSSQAKSGR